jgi:hypothetical protein
MSALVKLAPTSQVLFGSADLRAIERENALALFSRSKA